MKKSMVKIAVLGLLAAAIAVAPGQAFGQETKKEDAAKKEGVEKAARGRPGTLPFRGKIAAVDQAAKTLTVGERIFQITSETRIVKADKPATLADAVVGEEVGGSYVKGDDGKLTARMVRIGPKPESDPSAKKEAPKKDKKAE